MFVPDDVRYSGELDRGIVVVNHLKRGGIGWVPTSWRVRNEVPLDLVGMDAESLGGLGEVAPVRSSGPVRVAISLLFQSHSLHKSGPGRDRGHDDRAAGHRPGDDRARHGHREQRSASSLPTQAASSSQCAIFWPTAGRPGVWARNTRRAALERFSIRRFAHDWEDAFRYVTERPLPDRTLVSQRMGVCL